MPSLLGVAFAATAAVCPGSAVDRLGAWVDAVNPYAVTFSGELAARIIIEAKRRRIPKEALAAIGWIETDYHPNRLGAAGEVGLWQLGAAGGDHQVPAGWDDIRRRFPRWVVVRRYGLRPWARLPLPARRAIFVDIRAGTYLAALEIRSAADTCYRMRSLPHRSGGRMWPPSRWYRHRGPDVFGHYNSGVRPPMPGYTRKLRSRSRMIAAWLACRGPLPKRLGSPLPRVEAPRPR